MEMQQLCCSKPTELMIAPYFNGRGFPDACNEAYGIIKGLNFETTPAHIYQGIMESVAFEGKICLEKIIPYKEEHREISVFTSGGGANSDYWMQMKANIYGRNVVRLKHKEEGTMGAMIFAAIGEGCYDSFDTAFERCIRVKEIYHPDEEICEMYYEKYIKYLSFREKLGKL